MSVSDTLCIACGLQARQDWALHVSEQEFISPQSKRLHVTILDVFLWELAYFDYQFFSLSIPVDLSCHISLGLMSSTFFALW